jgi:cytochrome c peroxidase
MNHWFLLIIYIFCFSCQKEFSQPENFPPMLWPEGNEFSNEKVLLGKKLFFDPILSIHKKLSLAMVEL